MRFLYSILTYILGTALTFGSLCYVSIKSYLNIVDFLQFTLALIPIFFSIGVFLLSQVRYSPRLVFRISGEQQGEPIPMKQKNGSIMFGVSTKNALRTLIEDIWVYFKDQEVSLTDAHGEVELTVDRDFPFALHYRGPWTVIRKHWQGRQLSYEMKENVKTVTLKFVAKGHLEETEIRFPFSFLSPKREMLQRMVRFESRNGGYILIKDGFEIGPKESIASSQ